MSDIHPNVISDYFFLISRRSEHSLIWFEAHIELIYGYADASSLSAENIK